MKERPIIFSGEMVRAILDGRKTQTRRVVKPQPFGFWGTPDKQEPGFINGVIRLENGKPADKIWECPYGSVGDRLWVRETHAQFAVGDRSGTAPQAVAYRATCGADGGFDYVNNGNEAMRLKVTRWTSSIHMPRWASRMTLEITGIRVERVQDLSEADAIAEGVAREGDGFRSYETILRGPHRGNPHPHSVAPNRAARTSYREIWNSLNYARGFGWDANPWVWVVEFQNFAKKEEAAA